MVPPVIKRFATGVVPPALLFVLLLASLYLLSYSTEQAGRFANLYEWMLLVNASGLLVLITLIGVNLFRLLRQRRTGVVGSRLTVRMVMLFVVLAVVPTSIVYYFSFQFLQRGIDSWFDVKIEQPLQDALELSQASLDLRKRELLKRTQEMARELTDVPDSQTASALNRLRGHSEAMELTVLGQNSRIIAFSSADPTVVVPHRPSDEIMLQLRQASSYIALEPIGDSGLQIRVAVAVPSATADSTARYLQALYPFTQRINTLANSVQTSFAKYKALAYQRKLLKKSFLLTLSMVLLLSVLSAVWAAFVSSRRLVKPIRDLAEGTHAVAEGNYDKRLPITTHDELGFLVRSFNDMTRKVAQASYEARRSQQQVERQRAYLEAVLANLSSGVMTLGRDNVLRTANAAASQILGIPLDGYLGDGLVKLTVEHPHIRRFVDSLAPHVAEGELEWHEEIALFRNGTRQILICRGTNLSGHDSGRADQVIVFDDVTTLVQAQRDAAWGEVARRLAHEIKNPLTPIQLSAERLRHKYLNTMPEKDAALLDRATHTIVQQVESMKEMVNAFSEYARAPHLQLAPLDLNALVTEVMELYTELDVHTDLDPDAPMVQADAGRLRQLLHNLVKNAQEAMHERKRPRVDIRTHCSDGGGVRMVELAVRDYGHGLPEAAETQHFEPYVTTKPKGTGLGLAIVKKIVEEHGGAVWIENVRPSTGVAEPARPEGAQVVVRLPLLARAGMDAAVSAGEPGARA
jgi:nitrogen fixation/metabolism regulation signal transduction histidine kinase